MREKKDSIDVQHIDSCFLIFNVSPQPVQIEHYEEEKNNQ